MGKLSYYAKYAAGSYLDLLVSLPILTSESVSKTSERMLRDNTPEFLKWEKITQKSQTYKMREKLRDDLDTRAGSVFLQSNLLAAIPFALVGVPAAELAQRGIDNLISDFPEIVKYATNSSITLMAQTLIGYTTFMINEVRENREKYTENGRIKPGKVYEGLKKAVKSFLSFDILYTVSKILGQSWLLYKGKDPWKATLLFDTVALPTFFLVAIPLGLHYGIIETKKADRK